MRLGNRLYALGIALAGCGGDAADPLEAPPVGRLASLPETLDLGDVPVGETRWRTFRVAVADATQVRAVAPRCPASFCARPADVRREGDAAVGADPLGDAVFTVRWAPEAPGALDEQVELSWCDEPACVAKLAVRGRAVEGGAFCAPNFVDFGAVAIGGHAVREVRCSVDGGGRVPSQIAIEGAGFEARINFDAVVVTARPQAGVPYDARLFVDGVAIELRAEGIDAPGCDLEARDVTFGSIPLLESRVRPMTLENVRPGRCLVSGANVAPNGPFSIPEPGLVADWLAPHESTDVPVAFRPVREGPNTGTIEVFTPDGLEVGAFGFGVDAQLRVYPESLDLTRVSRCGPPSATLYVANLGTADARIVDVGLEGASADAVVLNTSPPSMIRAGQTIALEVATKPRFVGRVDAQMRLVIETLTARSVRRIDVSGVVEPGPIIVEQHQQLGLPKLDMLFIVDAGPAMAPFADSVATNVRLYLELLQRQSVDALVGITTSDPGDLDDGRVRDVATSQMFEDLFDAVDVGNGTSTISRGFDVLSAVATATASFWRRDVPLGVVMVSNGDDASLTSIDETIQTVTDRVGERRPWSFFAATGDAQAGCTNGALSAAPAPRYLDLVERTGGGRMDLCSPEWGRGLEDLSPRASGFRSRFYLTRLPVVSTLTVTVNDVLVEPNPGEGRRDWSYDEATNSVNFSPFATPEPNAIIVLRYEELCP